LEVLPGPRAELLQAGMPPRIGKKKKKGEEKEGKKVRKKRKAKQHVTN
jgi:hypothetical protein